MSPAERRNAGLRSRGPRLPDYAERMAWARRWRRTHWHVDWNAIARAEGGMLSKRDERADGMAFAREWKERHRGVDWAAVAAAEAGRLAA